MAELSDTFLLESEILDRDHARLYEMADAITDLLDRGEVENCKEQLLEFVRFAKGHFAREEQLLAKSGYPDIDKHRQHHRGLDRKMEHMLEFAERVEVNEQARESLKKELVYFVMDDVITSDLEFKAFIGEEGDG